METRKCKQCEKSKILSSFAQSGKDPRYRKWTCSSCRSHNRNSKRSPEQNKALFREQWIKRLEVQPYCGLLKDARRADRRKGLFSDLDHDFVASLLSDGCVYCGDKVSQMTVDRVDNSKGHLKDNVRPACLACNLTRGDMPYDAWLVVAKGMREAREKGLFADWKRSWPKRQKEKPK